MSTEESPPADALTREGFSRRLLAMRDETANRVVAAQKAGDRKEEAAWSRELRKLDKLIDRMRIKRPGIGA